MYFALVGTNWSYACPAPTKSVKLELSQTHPKKNASILQLVTHMFFCSFFSLKLLLNTHRQEF